MPLVTVQKAAIKKTPLNKPASVVAMPLLLLGKVPSCQNAFQLTDPDLSYKLPSILFIFFK